MAQINRPGKKDSSADANSAANLFSAFNSMGKGSKATDDKPPPPPAKATPPVTEEISMNPMERRMKEIEAYKKYGSGHGGIY